MLDKVLTLGSERMRFKIPAIPFVRVSPWQTFEPQLPKPCKGDTIMECGVLFEFWEFNKIVERSSLSLMNLTPFIKENKKVS